jgi:CRISPR/Cas system CMR subunit Cmr6 (Cas7 group RAMP superfamily)
VDILNSHHSQYYQGHTPPVEWEEKLIPVYFLAIGPGNEFEFALSPRPDCLRRIALPGWQQPSPPAIPRG